MRAFLAAIVVALAVSSASAADPTLEELLTTTPNFQITRRFLQRTGLFETLDTLGEATILAPTDFAWRQTATTFGCPAGGINVVVNCILDLLRGIAAESGTSLNQELSAALQYHVLPGRLTSKRILRKKNFESISGLKIFRLKLQLIDIRAGVPNPRLIPGKLDFAYDKGLVHSINRVLINSRNTDDPCEDVESPVVMQDLSFIRLIFILKRAADCKPFRKAILACDTPSVCRKGNAARDITKKLKVGKIVAAAVTCPEVVTALREEC